MNLSQIIDEVFGKVYKQCAKPVNLNEIDCYSDLSYRQTGCAGMDWILANHSTNGGLPKGRIIEIYGPEGSGKTTLAMVMAANVQKYKDRNVALIIDFENKLNIPYAISLGLNPDRTSMLQPSGKNAGESGLELMIRAADADDVGIIIIDSVSAVVSKEELEGELTDAAMCASARLWSKAIKKLNDNIKSNSPTVVLINQLRDNVGATWGSTEKTAGARAIKFACAARVDIRAKEKIEDKTDNIIGQTVRLKAVKNQVGRPFQETMIDVYFGEGYDNVKWLIDQADELGLFRTAAANKKENLKSGWFVQTIEGEQRMTRVQLTENLESKKNFKHLYQQCIDKTTANLEAASAARRSKTKAKDLNEQESNEEEAAF